MGKDPVQTENALAEEAAGYIDKTYLSQALCITACQRKADKCRQKANSNLHTEGEHREDEA